MEGMRNWSSTFRGPPTLILPWSKKGLCNGVESAQKERCAEYGGAERVLRLSAHDVSDDGGQRQGGREADHQMLHTDVTGNLALVRPWVGDWAQSTNQLTN